MSLLLSSAHLWELYRAGFAIALVVHSVDSIQSLDRTLQIYFSNRV